MSWVQDFIKQTVVCELGNESLQIEFSEGKRNRTEEEPTQNVLCVVNNKCVMCTICHVSKDIVEHYQKQQQQSPSFDLYCDISGTARALCSAYAQAIDQSWPERKPGPRTQLQKMIPNEDSRPPILLCHVDGDNKYNTFVAEKIYPKLQQTECIDNITNLFSSTFGSLEIVKIDDHGQFYTSHLQVQPVGSGHPAQGGLGVFAERNLTENELFGLYAYIGAIKTTEEHETEVTKDIANWHKYNYTYDLEFIEGDCVETVVKHSLTLDASGDKHWMQGIVARTNDCSDTGKPANAKLIQAWHVQYQRPIVLLTNTAPIKKGEELLLEYGVSWWQSYNLLRHRVQNMEQIVENTIAETAEMERHVMQTRIGNDLRRAYVEHRKERVAAYNAGQVDGWMKGVEEGYNEGKKEGYDKGKKQGFEAGKAKGYIEGFEAGKAKGYIEGFNEGNPPPEAEPIE